MGDDARDFVEELTRWTDSGAVWRVAADTDRGITVDLLRCGGGEVVDRFTTDDPRLRAFVTAQGATPRVD